MIADVIAIPMAHAIPAGVLGPEEVLVDVNAFLVPHRTGLVLVDTGMDPSGDGIAGALTTAGASWSDLSAVVVTHAHPDHTGGIDHVRRSAPSARVLAHPLEGLNESDPATDGDVVGCLRVFATPGHTPGHVSLIDEDRGVLLVGDCVGNVDGRLVRAPKPFTTDLSRAEHSLHRLLALRGSRVLLSHGSEIEDPWDHLEALLTPHPSTAQTGITVNPPKESS